MRAVIFGCFLFLLNSSYASAEDSCEIYRTLDAGLFDGFESLKTTTLSPNGQYPMSSVAFDKAQCAIVEQQITPNDVDTLFGRAQGKKSIFLCEFPTLTSLEEVAAKYKQLVDDFKRCNSSAGPAQTQVGAGTSLTTISKNRYYKAEITYGKQPNGKYLLKFAFAGEYRARAWASYPTAAAGSSVEFGSQLQLVIPNDNQRWARSRLKDSERVLLLARPNSVNDPYGPTFAIRNIFRATPCNESDPLLKPVGTPVASYDSADFKESQTFKDDKGGYFVRTCLATQEGALWLEIGMYNRFVNPHDYQPMIMAIQTAAYQKWKKPTAPQKAEMKVSELNLCDGLIKMADSAATNFRRLTSYYGSELNDAPANIKVDEAECKVNIIKVPATQADEAVGNSYGTSGRVTCYYPIGSSETNRQQELFKQADSCLVAKGYTTETDSEGRRIYRDKVAAELKQASGANIVIGRDAIDSRRLMINATLPLDSQTRIFAAQRVLPAGRPVTFGELEVIVPRDEFAWAITSSPDSKSVHLGSIPTKRFAPVIGLIGGHQAGGNCLAWQRTQVTHAGISSANDKRVAPFSQATNGLSNGSLMYNHCLDVADGIYVLTAYNLDAPSLSKYHQMVAAIAKAATTKYGAVKTSSPRQNTSTNSIRSTSTSNANTTNYRNNSNNYNESSDLWDDDGTLVFGWMGFDVTLSYRDVAKAGLSTKNRPDVRVIVPTFEIGSIYVDYDIFAWGIRWNAAIGGSLNSLFSDDTDSPRFGGQKAEAIVDGLLGIHLGAFTFAAGAGWHGLAGPITKNSSLAISAYLLSNEPDDYDDFAWFLRVTPIQLLAANEREFLSPLTIEWQMQWESWVLGAEFQYIAAPKPGDEDIIAEAYAGSLLFGFAYR